MSRGHKVLATFFKNRETWNNIAKQHATQDDREHQTNSHIEQHLANHDINSKVVGRTVHVHTSDLDAARHHLTDLGHHKTHNVVGGLNEGKKENLPFEPDPKPRKKSVVAGKHGEGYSTARHLARMAMQKQSEKMKKPIKEEEMSKKAQIVKSVAKKKKDSADTFQKDPIIGKSEVKM